MGVLRQYIVFMLPGNITFLKLHDFVGSFLKQHICFTAHLHNQLLNFKLFSKFWHFSVRNHPWEAKSCSWSDCSISFQPPGMAKRTLLIASGTFKKCIPYWEIPGRWQTACMSLCVGEQFGHVSVVNRVSHGVNQNATTCRNNKHRCVLLMRYCNKAHYRGIYVASL